MKNGTAGAVLAIGENRSDNRYLVFGIISILLWCFSGICFRKGADLTGSSMTYLTFMCGGGSLTAALLHYIRRQPLSDLYRLPPKALIAGFFGLVVYTMLLATAFAIAPLTDIGQVNLLNYMWPIWLIILGVIFLGNRPRLLPAASGLLLGVLGVIVSRGFDLLSQTPHSILPHFMALSGGFLFTLYLILLRKWKIPEEKGGTPLQFAICAIICALTALYNGDWQNMPNWSTATYFWVIFGAVGPVGIAYYFYEISVKNGPVFLIASLSYFIPIGSSLMIGVIFKESMNNGLLIGGILITIGAWLLRRAEN